VEGAAVGRALAWRFSEFTVGNVLNPELKTGCGVGFASELASCREKAVKGEAAARSGKPLADGIAVT
jgi:hypothetical protein